MHKTRKSRTAIPGYSLIPEGDHFKARKIGMTKERIKTDPAYKITRLHNEAFKHATKLGKLIRAALLPGTGIKNNPGPLTATLLNAYRRDCEPFYLQKFDNVWFSQLEGFNFNPAMSWDDCIKLEISLSRHICKKTFSVHIPGFMPSETIKAPEGITHARIIVGLVTIDPEKEAFDKHEIKTTILPLKQLVVDPVFEVVDMSKKKTGIWLQTAGISWYQKDQNAGKLTVSKTPGPLIIVNMGNF